jgi:hypothetical protein
MLAEGENADDRYDHGDKRYGAADECDCGAPTDPTDPCRDRRRGRLIR